MAAQEAWRSGATKGSPPQAVCPGQSQSDPSTYGQKRSSGFPWPASRSDALFQEINHAVLPVYDCLQAFDYRGWRAVGSDAFKAQVARRNRRDL